MGGEEEEEDEPEARGEEEQESLIQGMDAPTDVVASAAVGEAVGEARIIGLPSEEDTPFYGDNEPYPPALETATAAGASAAAAGADTPAVAPAGDEEGGE